MSVTKVLTVNDEPLEYEPGMTVEHILARTNHQSRMLAVWIDGDLVPRADYGTVVVKDGANVQVVHMIAGG